MFTEKDLSWFEEQDLLDTDLIQFEEVRFADGDTVITGDEFAALLHDECAIGLVIDGNLTVNGPMFIDEQHAVFVKGTVKCESFGIYASPFSANALHANSVRFSEAYDQMMETWECDSVTAKVVLAQDEDEQPANVSSQYFVEEPEEYGPVLECMLEENFAPILAALEGGATLDDEWIQKNAALCTNEIVRNKYLG